MIKLTKTKRIGRLLFYFSSVNILKHQRTEEKSGQDKI